MYRPDFIEIPSRPFRMGSLETELSALARAYSGTRESYREEAPQHTLTLPTFAIAQTPVTHAQYAAFVAATHARPPIPWRGPQPPERLHDHPVVDVSWEEARAYCAWLSEQAQTEQSPWPAGVYRLPSEAEWECAARGDDGRWFPWGNTWEQHCANTREALIGTTQPVGSYPEGISPAGCLDMAGTVWEWTASLDQPYPYRAEDGREDPTAPGRRILRGGCYANPHGYARCACRFRLTPTSHNEFLGFRLAYQPRAYRLKLAEPGSQPL
jgi:formylglycine-generating enzyme required for sulfatase activity